MRKSITVRAAVAIPRANLLLRQIAPGLVVECGPTNNPIAVSANTANAGDLVPANTLADDIFALTADSALNIGEKVQLATLGRVGSYFEGGILVGRAVSQSLAANDIVYVAVDTSTLIGGGGGPGGGGIPEAPTDGQTYARRGDIADWVALEPVIPAPPGLSVPNGNVIGMIKGASYVQLAAGGTYIARVWYFNGTTGTNTGWI